MQQQSIPLAEQISNRIIDYIIENDLKPNEKLGTEKELTEMMGVGRSTIREAIKLLVSRNILEVRHGSGTFVANNVGITEDPLGFSFEKDKQQLTKDLLAMRMLIEPPITAMAAQNATEDDLIKIERSYNKVHDLIIERKPYIEEDMRFHKAIAQASKNIVVPKLLPIINQAINLFTVKTEYKLVQETIETHRAMVEAIKNHDPIAAQDASTLHIIYNRDLLRKMEQQK